MSNSEAHDFIYPFIERFGRATWNIWFAEFEPPLPMFAEGEIPDSILFGERQRNHVIDVKTSYEDSARQLGKRHVDETREDKTPGMGMYRWILAHESLSRIVVPDKWGSLKYNDAGDIWIVSEAEPFPDFQRNLRAEIDVLARIIRKQRAQAYTPAKAAKGQAKQAKLSAKQHELVRVFVQGIEDSEARPMAKYAAAIAGAKVMALIHDVEHGLIEGVEAFTESGVTYLTATATKATEAA